MIVIWVIFNWGNIDNIEDIVLNLMGVCSIIFIVGYIENYDYINNYMCINLFFLCL